MPTLRFIAKAKKGAGIDMALPTTFRYSPYSLTDRWGRCPNGFGCLSMVLSLDVFENFPDKIDKGATVFARPCVPRSFLVVWELPLDLGMIGGKAFMQLKSWASTQLSLKSSYT